MKDLRKGILYSLGVSIAVWLLLGFAFVSCKSEKPMPHYQTKYHTPVPFDYGR